MNKARVLPRVAFWSVAALTLAAVCLRTAAFLTGYDGDIGYFRSAAVTVVYRVLCLFVVLIPAVCGMLIPEGGLSAPCIGAGRDLSASVPLIASLITIPFFLQSSSGKAVTPIRVPCWRYVPPHTFCSHCSAWAAGTCADCSALP